MSFINAMVYLCQKRLLPKCIKIKNEYIRNPFFCNTKVLPILTYIPDLSKSLTNKTVVIKMQNQHFYYVTRNDKCPKTSEESARLGI